MLLSSVIYLTPINKRPYTLNVGRKAHGWFFEHIEKFSPGLATVLHGSNAFTISGLRPQARQYQGDYYLRITSLSSELSDLLITKALKKLPEKISLGAFQFKVDGYAETSSKHPWAGQSSFANLSNSQPKIKDREVTLEFASPTSFRSNGKDIPLPLPEHVYRSYLNKWNSYVSVPLQIEKSFVHFVKSCVMVNRYELNTSSWSLPSGGWDAATGFVGEVTFLLLSKSKAKKWQGDWDLFMQHWHMLSNFAFYCGTGHHVTSGMGQTRLITISPYKSNSRPKERKRS
jgi:CRISPR-associated endoribonuclease Cas6